jgi:segregation and condensation protein B
MDISTLIPHVESLIFASDRPLTATEITELVNSALGYMEDKISLDQIESAIASIAEKYQGEIYPFEIKEYGGGWQFLTKKEYHKTIAQLNGEKFLKRLSTAALETLAIIAYRQPVTKTEIESIRGVNSDYSIQKLLEKELVVITGRNEALPGKPLEYATSRLFMDYFGINSSSDLPTLREVMPENFAEPTLLRPDETDGKKEPEQKRDEDFVQGEANPVLLISETGELMENSDSGPADATDRDGQLSQ